MTTMFELGKKYHRGSGPDMECVYVSSSNSIHKVAVLRFEGGSETAIELQNWKNWDESIPVLSSRFWIARVMRRDGTVSDKIFASNQDLRVYPSSYKVYGELNVSVQGGIISGVEIVK